MNPQKKIFFLEEEKNLDHLKDIMNSCTQDILKL
jgi:hypothetical protein